MNAIISYGDHIHNSDYYIHSRSASVINFYDGCRFTFLVSQKVGAGPLNLVYNYIDLSDVSRLKVSDEIVQINNNEFTRKLIPVYESAIPVYNILMNETDFRLELLSELLQKNASEKSLSFLLSDQQKKEFKSAVDKQLYKTFSETVKEFNSGGSCQVLKNIKGLGYGLTPSGDDFIAGVMIAANVLNQSMKNIVVPVEELYNISAGNNLISNQFFYLAKSGLINQKLKDLFHVIFSSSELKRDELIAPLNGVLASGATSGADLLVGIIIGLKRFLNDNKGYN